MQVLTEPIEQDPAEVYPFEWVSGGAVYAGRTQWWSCWISDM